MRQNITSDVIRGCRDTLGGNVAACCWEKEENMEMLNGRRRQHGQLVEETEIHRRQQKGQQWEMEMKKVNYVAVGV